MDADINDEWWPNMLNETVKVIVTDRDYDVEWGVDDYDPEFDDVGDSITVDKLMYEEYCTLVGRLGELEEYFDSFISDNRAARIKEWEEAKISETKARQAAQEAAMRSIGSDIGYQKAQERITNAISKNSG